MSAVSLARAAGAVALALAVGCSGVSPSPATTLGRAADDRGPVVLWRGARDSLSTTAAPDTGAAGVAAWRERLADPALAPAALHVLGELRMAAADTAGADSCWRAAPSLAGPWAWAALQSAAALARSRFGPAAADSLLAGATRDAWTDADRAAWLERRARLRAEAGDGPQAAAIARQLVLAYPGIAGPAARGFALLDSLATARGDSVSMDELRAGAEADVFRGARPAAIAKLRRAVASSPRATRFEAALRLAEVYRVARMPLAAATAADSAIACAPDAEARARGRLERARALRDAGRVDSALSAFARVGSGSAGGAARAAAWWEYAREAQDRGRYREACAGFVRVVHLGARRADDAAFQAGLMLHVLGAPDSARAWWRRARGENAQFWLGVTLRASDRATSDSLLRDLARRPGYAFHRAAARDTLGVRGWPDSGAAVAAPSSGVLPPEPAVRALAASARAREAAELLGRWAAGDERAGAARRPGRDALLAATALAFELGRPALGTRLAERAFAAAASDSEAWASVPWAYPPAWSAAVAAADSIGIERALLWALVRQESRFDPSARSISDALGLAQLKLATAGDAARRLREPVPAERELFEPARSIRLGAAYLAWLLRRFAGSVPVALAAYNAGPGTIRADWRELIARGGDALFCELASNADSQDYARRILGFRQAYRELRPGLAP